MSRAKTLDRARDSFRKKEWGTAVRCFTEADREAPLEPMDVAELAQATLLIGKQLEGADLLARAHRGFVQQSQSRPAARCAFWAGFMALLNGQNAVASGWLARAARCLENEAECAEKAYLLLPDAYRAFQGGDLEKAESTFREAVRLGKKFGEHDLVTLALQGQGRALLRQGEIARGTEFLDEAMIAVTAGEVSALNAGGVYCSVLDACTEIYDLRRAQEWTEALDRWCASQPDLVPYRGHCQVRRAELLHVHGEWTQALDEAKRACEALSIPVPSPAAGGASYVAGEIHRLRGKFTDAEKAYGEAAQWQSIPGPGLALLRLAQGQPEAAASTIRRLLEQAREPGKRARMLEAQVEIALAAGDLDTARASEKSLLAIASERQIPFLHALARRATGALLLAEGDSSRALTELRKAWELWCELQVPYEAARIQVLQAQAYEKIGDAENARIEREAARRAFTQLGATFDLAQLDARETAVISESEGLLTDRELEVLRLVAKGSSNRRIAEALTISEKTVARHMSNIFNKLDLTSRTAAAAYAYDRGLV